MLHWTQLCSQSPVNTSTITQKSYTNNSEAKAIREWGRENGYETGSRGRLPFDLIEAYRASSE